MTECPHYFRLADGTVIDCAAHQEHERWRERIAASEAVADENEGVSLATNVSALAHIHQHYGAVIENRGLVFEVTWDDRACPFAGVRDRE